MPNPIVVFALGVSSSDGLFSFTSEIQCNFSCLYLKDVLHVQTSGAYSCGFLSTHERRLCGCFCGPKINLTFMWFCFISIINLSTGKSNCGIKSVSQSGFFF